VWPDLSIEKETARSETGPTPPGPRTSRRRVHPACATAKRGAAIDAGKAGDTACLVGRAENFNFVGRPGNPWPTTFISTLCSVAVCGKRRSNALDLAQAGASADCLPIYAPAFEKKKKKTAASKIAAIVTPAVWVGRYSEPC